MIKEYVQRIPRTRGRRLRLLTGVVLLSTITGSIQTDNLIPVSVTPTFISSVANITVQIGKEAIFSCSVANLSTFTVEWWYLDNLAMLTMADTIVMMDQELHRKLSVKHSENTWSLHIRDVAESNRGTYMCKINTEPLMHQIGYLEVVVPPNILDNLTSTNMTVNENNNVLLRCEATGTPMPNITWKREDMELITLGNNQKVASIDGPFFNITKVNRLQMGAYLCIASNGVLPTVSKRIILTVHVTPRLIPNQLVGVRENYPTTLMCLFEAFPKPINYWMRENSTIMKGEKTEIFFSDNVYKINMTLTIPSVAMSDYGIYKCISENVAGQTNGNIELYREYDIPAV